MVRAMPIITEARIGCSAQTRMRCVCVRVRFGVRAGHHARNHCSMPWQLHSPNACDSCFVVVAFTNGFGRIAVTANLIQISKFYLK